MVGDKSEELGKTSGDYPILYRQNLGRSAKSEIPDPSNRLNRQSNNAARRSRALYFFLLFFAVTTRLRTFHAGCKQATYRVVGCFPFCFVLFCFFKNVQKLDGNIRRIKKVIIIHLNLDVVVSNSVLEELACI